MLLQPIRTKLLCLPRIKIDAKQIKRTLLNSIINEEVLNAFNSHCKSLELPMNLLVEFSMEQFVSGKFVLKINKANKIAVGIDDETENLKEK